VNLSFRARLALRWTIAFGLLLSAADFAIYRGVDRFLRADLDANLRTLAATELASSTDEPGGAHLHEFPDALAAPYNEKFVQLIGADGQVLLQSPRLNARGPLLTAEQIKAAFAGRPGVVDVRTGERRGRMVALRTAGPQAYLVAVGLYTTDLEATLDLVFRLLLGVWIGSMLLTGAIGHFLSSRALLPIRRITSRAAAIADGEFAVRLDAPAADDEIGRMTRLLNRMLDRLFGAIDANRRFASDASHELRSPLTAMLGELDVTLKRERSSDEYRETLTMVRDRLRQMATLTDDLMMLVRAQERKAGHVTDVRLRPMLDAVLATHADRAAAQGLTLSCDVDPSLVVYGDEAMLRRVFDNLVRNAVQYTTEGNVRVDATLERRSGDWVTDMVVVTVRDTGPGIPAEERERVFERFYRLDPSRSRRTGGSGLGLAIAREIVHLFGGRIRVAEGDGPGAVLEVKLPGARAR
jgi:two-component system OmpR family sensor kinase